MKEKPILFSGPMVRAIQDGHKTQTRRIVKPQPETKFRHLEVHRDGTCEVGVSIDSPNHYQIHCPYGAQGARLWVRETFALCESRRDPDNKPAPIYRANGNLEGVKWKPSIFMPRWASRITLEITGIRGERLQDISEADAKAEGLHKDAMGLWTWGDYPSGSTNPVYAYRLLWESINGNGSWDLNQWVWVVEFRQVK